MLAELLFVAAMGQAPEPFRAVGLYCDAPAEARASADGANWTSWMAGHSHQAGDGTLLWFETPQRYLEVSRPCQVLFVEPGPSPKRPSPVRRADDGLAVVSRQDWGCTPASCPAAAPPSYTNVTHLAVHHSAGANEASDWAAVVRSIWILHVRGNGWNDIGYNYLIDPDGVLYEGRAGGDGVLGAHFSGVNTGTMGVCLLGTFSNQAVTPKALATLQALLTAKARRWGLDAGGRSPHAASGLELNVISGHRDAGLSPRATSTTECPGNGLYAVLPQLRRQVHAALAGECAVQVGRPYRCASASGDEVEFRLLVPPGCPVEVSGAPAWIISVTGDDVLRLRVEANAAAARRNGVLRVNGQTLTVVQGASNEGPLACAETVASAAGFDDRPVVPGGLMSVLGSGLSDAVTVNGRAVSVLYASDSQINAVLPPATPIGSARVVVGNGPERLFSVTEVVPGILGVVYEGSRLQVWLTGLRPGAVLTANLGTVESVQASMPGVWVADIALADEPAQHLVVTGAGVASLPFPIQ
ncbi:MAG: N-acetylmuramoyl-L-alanine amidase [Bryobacterales bacterium]|nr:N-acetylmuramoyl-L-alanine amidase [Bryobacterales bacterium]